MWVSMSSSMGVTMASTSVGVTVASPSMLKDENADQVDNESENGDHKEPLVLDLWRLNQPLHGLGEDEEGDEQQKEAVDEAGKYFCSLVPEKYNTHEDDYQILWYI